MFEERSVYTRREVLLNCIRVAFKGVSSPDNRPRDGRRDAGRRSPGGRDARDRAT